MEDALPLYLDGQSYGKAMAKLLKFLIHDLMKKTMTMIHDDSTLAMILFLLIH